MVKLTVGQAVKTEFDSKWHITRVAKVNIKHRLVIQ